MKQDDYTKIERYISGVADDIEKEFVESLFIDGEDNSTLRHLLDKDFKFVLADTSPSEVNLMPLLDKIHHNIRKYENIKRQPPLRRLVKVYMKVAAILLIPLLMAGGLVYNYFGFNRNLKTGKPVNVSIYAPMGSRVSFNLPDGTIGKLNSGSHLSYILPFINKRQIQLEGEAWLEVARDEVHPFEITVSESLVKVLGTKLNVSAYPEENYVEVVLQEGKVEFRANNGDEKVMILPSERLIFQDGNITKSVTDPVKYYAWTEGKLVFRGDPMAEVARRIERWYNVEVELAEQKLEKYSFRATFVDDTLVEVLDYLSMTSPIRYEITPRKLITQAVYEKEKVTIHLINKP